MSLSNASQSYGGLTKFFHWVVFFGFVFQYFVAAVMTRIAQAETFWGFTQGFLYNWHKSVGLLIFGFVIFRYIWRRVSTLPDWAPTLTKREQKLIHRYEQVLYLCMFLMPISGYAFVMAGGYGVHFFGIVHLPNPIGKIEWLALIAEWTHWLTAILIVIALVLHIGLVLKHQLIDGDGLLNRMLPFTD
jgi:cytochrome b561